MSKNLNKSSRQGLDNLGDNPGEKLYKVKEVSVLIGESDHVIRHWLKSFDQYIPTQRSEAGYHLFGQKAIEALRTIQQLHRTQGYSMKQIEHYLATGGEEMTPPVPIPERIGGELAELKDMMEQQKQFNQALIDRLDRQQAYIEQAIQKRDEQLTGALRALQEARADKKTLIGRIRRFFE